MNMEFSNKTLAWLVVATIVVSLAGTLISVNRITQGANGLVTFNTTGNATVSITTQTQLNFIVSALNFGVGQVNASVTTNYQCNMSLNKSNAGTFYRAGGCVNFSTTNAGGALTLQNDGNTFLNVSLNFSTNAAGFIGGGGAPNPLPLFKFSVSENESGSCFGGMNATMNNTYFDVVANQWIPVCSGSPGNNLLYADGSDSLTIGIFIGIPSDAQGNKNVTITAMGTS